MKKNKKHIVGLLPILLFVFTFPLTGWAQDYPQKKVDVEYKGIEMKEILKDLTQKVGVEFLYNLDEIKQVKSQTFGMKQVTVKQVLDRCFEGTSLGYKYTDWVIVITLGKVTPQLNMIKLTGKVTSGKNEPLIGATVSVKGTTLGVATDIDGNYVLNVPKAKDMAIVISFVGMKTEEIKVQPNKMVYDAHLEDDEVQMEDVVVTGIFKKKTETYTGAVTTITEKELKSFGNRNLITTIGNIDPSFRMIQNNDWGSDPNKLSEMEIQIRGASSLPDVQGLKDNTRVQLNTPLIIMDGFEITLERMVDLDENEVSSITLLKDGSATAIYGSRGANGVIVITTKEPESGKLRLSYQGNLNVEMPDLSDYHLLNARQKLEMEVKAGYYDRKASQAPEGYLISQKRYNEVLQAIDKGVDTYWLSQPLRTGVGQRHNLKIDGGDDSFRYSASLQYNKTVGVMKKSDRTNFNGGINLSYRRENLIFRNSLTIGVNKAKNSPYGSFSEYAKQNPYWQPYDENGDLVKVLEESTFYKGPQVNPMYNATLNTINSTDYTSLINNFSIEWRPLKGISFLGKIGISSKTNNSDDFKPADHTDFASYFGDRMFERGRYDYGTGKDFSYDVSLQVNYSKLFAKKHMVSVGVNLDATEKKSRTYGFSVQGFTHESIDFLASALQYTKDAKPTGSESTSRRVGIVTNVAYAYSDRYLFDFSFRTDGSSQFGANKRYAPFYSAGIGWNMHKEAFMESITFVNQLKLRASYGLTGSQNFSAYQAVETYRYYLDDRYINWLGAYQAGLANDDLEWQRTDKYNLGLDCSLFNGSFSFQANIYLHKTNNLLSSLELPYSNGFTNYTENIGAVENRGFDLHLSAYLLRDTERQMIWTVTGNIARDQDKIVKLSEVMKQANEELAATGGANPNRILREGDSQNVIYSVRSLGIDPSTGKELYLNRFGEATFTWDASDRVNCGTSLPKYRGNLSSMFRYKDFSINVSFGYEWGGQVYNSTLISKIENADILYNVDDRVYSARWEKPGDVTFFKGIKDETTTQHTSRFIQDERVFKCQNINLAYEIMDKAWLRQYLGAQSIRLSGDIGDVFYLSSVRRERGISYPFARAFSVALAIVFR